MRLAFLYFCDFNIQVNKLAGPYGLPYLISYLTQKKGIDLEVTIEVDVDRIISYKPDIVGMSVFTNFYNKAILAAEKIKKYLNIPIIIGGSHITALPETLDKNMDIGVIGYGEETFSYIIELYLKDGKFNPSKLKNISGIVYHKENEIIIQFSKVKYNKYQKYSLDDLPPPDWKILKTYWVPQKKVIRWEGALFSSRGCPFKCKFCIRSTIREKMRFHSPERVISDIKSIIYNYPDQQLIPFSDELFVVNKKRLEKIVKLIRQEKIHLKRSFFCMVRPSIFDKDICLLLRDMNVQKIFLGIESGSNKVLKYLKGKDSSVEKNKKALELCTRYGFDTGIYIITGSPIETKEDLTKSYWFVKRYNPFVIPGVFVLAPYPGNKFWNYSIKKKLINDNDWCSENYAIFDHKKSLLLNKNYSSQDFENYFLEFKKLNRTPDLLIDQDKLNVISRQDYWYKTILNILPFNIQDILEITNFESRLNKYLPENYRLFSTNINFSNLEHKKFDLIFINHSLENVRNKTYFLYKISGLLRKNGYLVITFYNVKHIEVLITILINNWHKLLQWKLKQYENFHFFSLQTIRNLLRTHGFEILNVHKKISIINETLSNKLYKILLKYIKINEFLSDKDVLCYLIIAKQI